MFKSLDDLPAELVNCVIANVDSNHALCNLALCSRDLYHFTIPRLYHHVELEDEICGSGRREFKHIRKLTTLFLRNQEIAHLVHHFTVRGDLGRGHKSREVELSGGKAQVVEVDGVLKTQIKKLSASKEEEKEWLKHVSWTDHDDAILVLLLATLRNIQKLDLMLTFDTYFTRMIRRVGSRRKPFDSQPAFEQLSEFMHTCSVPEFILTYLSTITSTSSCAKETYLTSVTVVILMISVAQMHRVLQTNLILNISASSLWLESIFSRLPRPET